MFWRGLIVSQQGAVRGMLGQVLRPICNFSMVFFISSVVFAQTGAKTSPAKPTTDLSGIWVAGGGMEGASAGRGFSTVEPPLLPATMAIYRANRAGLTNANDKGLDELDPNTYCFPPGAPRSMVMPYAFEIVQRPDIVYILFEYNSGIRRIYLDGRKHPAASEPTWMGTSTGTWEGSTLVVDTVGLRPETWIDPLGTPHSDALHMVERFRRPDQNTLEVQFLFEDPKTFSRPWGGTRTYRLDNTEISEYLVCEDQLRMGKSR